MYEYHLLTEKLKKFVIEENGKLKISKEGELLLFKRSRILAGARNKPDLLISLMQKYKCEEHILVYCGATSMEDEEAGEKMCIRDRYDHGAKMEHAQRLEIVYDTKKRLDERDLYTQNEIDAYKVIRYKSIDALSASMKDAYRKKLFMSVSAPAERWNNAYKAKDVYKRQIIISCIAMIYRRCFIAWVVV